MPAPTVPGYEPPPPQRPGGDAFGLPPPSGPRAVKDERRRLRGAGLRGAALRGGVQQFREKRRADMDEYLRGSIPDEMEPYIRNPRRFARGVLQGKGPAFRRLAFLKQAQGILGYGDEQKQLSGHYSSELEAGAPVDYREGSRPTFDQYGSYLRERLGQGLTPEEEAAIRGREREAVEGAARESSRLEGSRLGAAGMDPRSGMGAQRYGNIARAREKGLVDVERGITLADLARKGEIEGQTARYTGLEEGARQYDVGAGLRRLATVEGGLGQMANLDESQRTYDLDYTESQRQAALARAAAKRAAKALEPSGWEQASEIVGGVLGGLTG